MSVGARIHLAREARGLTQQAVARRTGVKQPVLSWVERDLTPAPPALIRSLIPVLGFPESFFYTAAPPSLDGASLRFRARAGAATRDLVQYRRTAELVFEHHERMRAQVRTSRLGFAAIDGLSVSAATAHTRASLDLSPEGPIPFLTLAAERAGIAIVAMPLAAGRSDAFSVWKDERPVVAMLGDVSGDRLRFSLAHELGHLLLHGHGPTDSKAAEAEADAFAAELLMPKSAFAERLPSRVTLGTLLALKGIWGVSLRALIRQAYSVGAISREQYSSLFRQLGARKWTRHEPAPVPVERPRAFRKMAEVLYGQDIDVEAMAASANWTPSWTLEVLAQHAGPHQLPLAGATVARSESNVVRLRPRTGRN
jgi:Zn-dependent peptidase ImmA (M78 family)/transcriptional regulator with XRE-family HTH domain